MKSQQAHQTEAEASIRPLRENDLPTADRIFRLAFGTFLGFPEPLEFFGDADYVRTRWRAAPSATLGAELGGELVGSNFATRWGSFGFFGPLTVRPDLWEKGIAKRLLEGTMELFAAWETQHVGLFTFSHSPKHLALYQRFDFWPGYLTTIMSKPVAPPSGLVHWSPYSAVPERERGSTLEACANLTGAIYEGLDVEREIRAVAEQGLGDTVLLWDDGKLDGLAVCHWGPGTEAGSGACYVKFGAVRPGPNSGQRFDRLLDAVEAIAAERGIPRLVAGVNTGRSAAYRQMLARGFRTDMVGVAMHRRGEPGYNRPDAYVIDDWR